MHTRRDFLQYALNAGLVLGAAGLGANPARALAQQKLTQDDLLRFDAKGQLTLLHFTDCHAQLKPVFFRPPDTNIGVGAYAGLPPHLVAEEFLSYFNIEKGSPYAYAHTMVDYVDLARSYGKLGGLDRTATLVKAIRAERGDDKVLFLDGGDTWQGSYSSLKTNGMDMVECMKLLKPDAMTGHWEFTFGQDRFLELVEAMGYPFLASNIFDSEWDEPAFEHTAFFERGGVNVAVIGQSMPYTPIANPNWMFPKWSFGIRPETLQANVDAARAEGAEVVVLLSHNGFDVDRKLAGVVSGLDVIVTGHTHDATPVALEVEGTLLMSSGSHGKYLGRIDLDIRDGKVAGYNSTLIPVFSDVITPDPEMAAKIDEVRAPYEAETQRVIGRTGDDAASGRRHHHRRSLFGDLDELSGGLPARVHRRAAQGHHGGCLRQPVQQGSFPAAGRRHGPRRRLHLCLRARRGDGQPDLGHAAQRQRRGHRGRQELHGRRLGLGQRGGRRPRDLRPDGRLHHQEIGGDARCGRCGGPGDPLIAAGHEFAGLTARR